MKTAEFEFASRRSPVLSTGGMAAASQTLAVEAGIETLRQGGNAADAAVAMAAALNVTEPTSTGIGGDCFALYYEVAAGKVHALNGSGRAPAKLTPERLQQEGFEKELPPYHAHTVTVPGACAGWCDLVERFGRLPLAAILAPAVRLAEQGFPVAPLTAYFWQRGADRQLKEAPNGHELTIDGRGPRQGEIFRNPGLGRTLRVVAEGGKQAFYEGQIGADLAAVVQKAGGVLSEADLAAHTSTWEEAIHVDYRGVRIWECPPNGQGLAALLALNILEGLPVMEHAPLSAGRLHYQIEAMRLAFADARWYVADPHTNPAPLEELLSKEYAAERRRLINPERAVLNQRRGAPFASSDTVYFCAVDADGNACSFINSNYTGFGTGIVPAGWGFTLQNRGHNFSLDAQHPNALAPGKRPYHTIIPAMATLPREGGQEDLLAAFGVMGGFMQPQGHMQVVSGLVDDDLDPQAALDRPRFCINDGTASGTVAIEEGIPAETFQKLMQMGHPLGRVRGYERAAFGRGQIILKDRESGVLWGGSDGRADGAAQAFLKLVDAP
jgi:gamma-glutamyltranspeptidase / glutathione hydrolase